MSTPINPTQGPTGVAPVDRAPAAGSTAKADAQAPAQVGAGTQLAPAVTLETTPGSPPAEVLADISRAAEAHQRLAEAGQEVRFKDGESGARAGAELIDRHGVVLRQLTAGEAIELAMGDGAEQTDMGA